MTRRAAAGGAAVARIRAPGCDTPAAASTAQTHSTDPGAVIGTEQNRSVAGRYRTEEPADHDGAIQG
jgi:hypothetical protein